MVFADGELAVPCLIVELDAGLAIVLPCVAFADGPRSALGEHEDSSVQRWRAGLQERVDGMLIHQNLWVETTAFRPSFRVCVDILNTFAMLKQY